MNHDNEIRFSVIVPTYNRPRPLRTLLKVLSQLDFPRPHYEVIVVDDGSTPPMDEVVKPFQSSTNLTLLRISNGGPGPARNAGASMARGEFLAFTDDDCEPTSNWLQALEERFRDNPDDIVGGQTMNRLIDNPFSTASQIIIDAAYAYYNDSPTNALFFASNNMAVPAKRFREVGGFDPDFRVASEDRELCNRWRHFGYKMTYAPDAVVYHGHPLTLRRFFRQHFNYGRGAWQYHHVRSRRGFGRLRNELPGYGRFLGLLREPMSKLGFRQYVQVSGLLVVWQLGNATGFFYEKYRCGT